MNRAINTRCLEVFCEKGVVRNFTKFIRKHLLCHSLLFNKVAGLFHRTPLVAASVFFQSFLLVLTKFSFWQENWALGYHSMKGVGFLCSKPLSGSKFNQLSLSNSGNIVVKSKLPPHKNSVALRQLNPIHKKEQ